MAMVALREDTRSDLMRAVVDYIRWLPPIRDVSREKFLRLMDEFGLEPAARKLAKRELASFEHLLKKE